MTTTPHPRSQASRPSRRAVLAGALSGLGVVLAGCGSGPAPGPASGSASPATLDPSEAQAELAALETRFGGRLGVVALDCASGATIRHRADERFLMASTAKVLIAAAIVRLRLTQPGLLERVIRYDRSTLLEYAPVTSRNIDTGMTVADLCDAAVTRSDNTAANLLLGVLGGPAAITAFARTLGDPVTRLDRIEPDLNDAAPGDERDTTTPTAITADLQTLILGDGLDPAGRNLLDRWLIANTTGSRQVRAGLPAGWRVGDKTGSGSQGEANDVAVASPPRRAPLVISVYTDPDDPNNDTGATTIAAAASIGARALVPGR